MRFMILVRGDAGIEAGAMPTEEQFAEMAAYHEELARAGALVDASGLRPTSEGWRVRWSDGERTVVDGPFTESKELVAGYTVIRVGSREEAEAWVRRFPNPGGAYGEIEVRRMFDLDDFEQGPAVERFRALGLSQGAETGRAP